MRKYDVYWMSKREWWEYRGLERVVKDTAPEDAKESYRNYIRQLEEESVIK